MSTGKPVQVSTGESLAQLNLALNRLRNDLFSIALDFGPSFEGSSLIREDCGNLYTIALESFQCWLELFHLYGFSFQQVPVSSIFRFVYRRILDVRNVVLSGVTWYSYFKYFNAAFYATVLGQEPPAQPEWIGLCKYQGTSYLFGGKFYTWQRKLQRSDCDKFRSFALSILMSKKGMPRPDKDLVSKGVAKTAKNLTTRSNNHGCRNGKLVKGEGERGKFGLHLNQQTIRSEVRRTVREIYGDNRFDLRKEVRPYLPSGSANYNWTRGKCGTYNEIQKSTAWHRFLRDPDNQLYFRTKMTHLKGYVSEYYGSRGTYDQFIRELDGDFVVGLEVDNRDFLKAWKRFWWRCVALAEQEEPNVCLVGLSEALKVRVISKGPPITYFVLKVFQRYLLSGLQRFSCFELTGTPVTEKLINSKLGRVGTSFRVSKSLHSGDLDSATDKMESWLSEMITDELFDLWEEQNGFSFSRFRAMFKKALTQHKIFYTDAKLTGCPHAVIFAGNQEIGQLMGSIISFPILCIGNATGSRIALEVSGNRWIPLRQYPGWFNGDDVLTQYESGTNYDAVWTEVMAFLGFNKSIGKCYDSGSFFNINSTTFEIMQNGNFRLVPYVNLGLIKGFQRSTSLSTDGKTVEVDVHQLGVLQRKLIDSCPPDLVDTVHALFRKRHLSELNKISLPWYLPVWAGGLGLYPPADLSLQDQQRFFFVKQLVAENKDLRPSYSSDKEWQHYDAALRLARLEEPLLHPYSYSKVMCDWRGEEESEDYLVYISYHIWEKYGIDCLYNPRKSQSVQALYKGARLIAKADKRMQRSKNLPYGSVLEYSLIQEPKKTVVPIFIRSKNDP